MIWTGVAPRSPVSRSAYDLYVGSKVRALPAFVDQHLSCATGSTSCRALKAASGAGSSRVLAVTGHSTGRQLAQVTAATTRERGVGETWPAERSQPPPAASRVQVPMTTRTVYEVPSTVCVLRTGTVGPSGAAMP